MEELLELVKGLEKKLNRECWLVFYTNGIVEVHNDHRAIIYADDLASAKNQLLSKIK